MSGPADSPPQLKFTLLELMTLVAALAVLLAGRALGYSTIPGLIACLVVAQFLARMLIATLPSIGLVLLGTGTGRELAEEDADRLREATREAMALCHAARYAEALDALLGAEAIQSGSGWNGIAQAWCLRKLGRLDQSLAPLERTAIHGPFEPLLHYTLACHWAVTGSAPRALESLSVALELDPELRECARDEPDLIAIRGEADFQRLVGEPEVRFLSDEPG